MGCVSDILSEKGHDVLTVDAATTVLDAVKAMVEGNVGSLVVTDGETLLGIVTERRLRHLPVLDDGDELTGIVSIGDVVKFQSQEQGARIRLLTEYISG